MAIPLTLPLVLSAIRTVMRYRQRVDEVLSLNEATKGLPFRLPPPPKDRWRHEEEMLAFFQTESGALVLEFNAMTAAFQTVRDAHTSNRPRPEKQIMDCFDLYFEACDINASLLLPPGASDAERRMAASTGPSIDMRLAYYVVEYDRLSRNSALTRVVLITADTLLEFVGENASAFISNPRTRGLFGA